MVKLPPTFKYLACGAVLVSLLVFATYRSCSLYDQNSVLKGRDIEMTAQLERAVVVLQKYKSNNVALFAQLEVQKKLATEAIEAANSAAETMVGEFRTIEYLKANTENDKALIVEMEIEINKRDELISKLTFTIAKQEKRYFTLNQQYNIIVKQLNLSDLVLQEYKKTVKLKDFRIKGLENSLKGIKFTSQIKTGVVVGLAAIVVYGLVKK